MGAFEESVFEANAQIQYLHYKHEENPSMSILSPTTIVACVQVVGRENGKQPRHGAAVNTAVRK